MTTAQWFGLVMAQHSDGAVMAPGLGWVVFTLFTKDADFCIKPAQYQTGPAPNTINLQSLYWHET